jgi:DNA-directed RNA polymerase subunit RPC12/RpoP
LFPYGVAGKLTHLQTSFFFFYQLIYTECGKDVSLKRSDQVRCRHCGHRVLLKKRTINPNFGVSFTQ